MTLGERIAVLRKEKGLSQEGLGEQIGVSRQAVSKWEADKAVPDVDNCVAMSKVFGVPLARLLELEEEETAADLTEQQLKLVEQVTERYLAAKAKARRRWRWPIILAVCALMVGAAWMWEWLNDMNSTIDYLSGEFAGMRGEIISGVGDRVQESLEAESSLITDYVIEVAAADVVADTITYDVTVNLKERSGSTQVSLMARAAGGIFTASVAQEAGLSYSGQITCPIIDETAIYLVVEEAGQSRSQLLEDMLLENDYKIRLSGWLRWAALQQSGLTEDAYEPVEIHCFLSKGAGLPEPLAMTKLEFVLFRNDGQVDQMSIDLALGHDGYNEWNLSGEFDIPVDIPSLKEGDTLTIALMGQDNYGRKASCILSRYTILADGQLEYEAYDIMELDDGTYGTEVWQ